MQIRFETAESMSQDCSNDSNEKVAANASTGEAVACNPPSYHFPVPQLTPVSSGPVRAEPQQPVEESVAVVATEPSTRFPIPQLPPAATANREESRPAVVRTEKIEKAAVAAVETKPAAVEVEPKKAVVEAETKVVAADVETQLNPPNFNFPTPRLAATVSTSSQQPQGLPSSNPQATVDNLPSPPQREFAIPQLAQVAVPSHETDVQLASWDATMPEEPGKAGKTSAVAPNNASTQTAKPKPSVLEMVPAPKGKALQQAPKQVSSAQAGVASDGTPLISLHVDNLEVSKAIELISRQAKIVNILVSPGVTGAVTVDLRNKTVDEALGIIAKQCRLTVRREKDIIYVSTLEEARQVESDDLPVRVYHLNYVRSADLKQMIDKVMSKDGKITVSPDSKAGMESDITDTSQTGQSGSTRKIDAGGNDMAGGDIVVVQDHEYVLKTIDRIVAQIDIRPVQVMIEAVIAQVTLDKDMNLGANLGFLDGAGHMVGVLGSGAAINSVGGFLPGAVQTGGQLATGLAGNTNGLKVGWNGKNTAGYIQALETYGKVKVLACPRVFVLNKQRAQIHLGQNMGYLTTNNYQTNSTQTVTYMKIGTQLRIRPFVSSDGMIRMEVFPERSTGTFDNAGIPQTKTAQVTTNLIVPDGETMIIGGLLDEEVSQNWSGIPFLSRLPWVGYLFRNTKDTVAKKELVVILTPHIWRADNPTEMNFLGAPKTLGMRKLTQQKPCEERRDGKPLLESIQPNDEPQDDDCKKCPPSEGQATVTN